MVYLEMANVSRWESGKSLLFANPHAENTHPDFLRLLSAPASFDIRQAILPHPHRQQEVYNHLRLVFRKAPFPTKKS